MPALSTYGAELALPFVLGGVALVVVVWAVGALTGRGSRGAVWVALWVCLAVIGWVTIGLTLIGGVEATRSVNLTPLQEIHRALDTGARQSWFNLVGNILMFLPFGALVAWLVRRGFLLRVITATFLGASLSLAIETVQFLLGRVADVDDVILNTAGAFLGGLIAAVVAAVRGAPGERARRSVGA